MQSTIWPKHTDRHLTLHQNWHFMNCWWIDKFVRDWNIFLFRLPKIFRKFQHQVFLSHLFQPHHAKGKRRPLETTEQAHVSVDNTPRQRQTQHCQINEHCLLFYECLFPSREFFLCPRPRLLLKESPSPPPQLLYMKHKLLSRLTGFQRHGGCPQFF